jgi:DHA2 family multidrug resistance protein
MKQAQQTPANPWLIAVVVALGAFMEVLDMSIANVSLPHIAGDLSADMSEGSYVLTSYLVTNAIVMPLTGWLSAMFGRKRVYLFCIVGFTVSSLLCGLAPNLISLVILRAIQGACGGGLQPTAQAILTDSFPVAKQGSALALYGMAAVFAPAVGPTLGGLITDHLSWRWVFLINIPVGIVVFALIAALVHDPEYMTTMRKTMKEAGRSISFDGIGIAMATLSIGCLQFVLDRGQQEDWFGSRMITTLVCVSAIAFVVLIVHELSCEAPIINLRLFRYRSFSVSVFLMLMIGAMLYGSTYLIPAFAQTLLGYTATDAGLVMTPGGFAIVICMPFVGAMVPRADLRIMIGIGLMIMSAATFHMTGFYLGVDYATITMARVYQAIGFALLFIPVNTLAFIDVPEAERSNASGLINVARNLGGSIGISFVVTVVARREQFHQNVLVSNLNNYDNQTRSFLNGAGNLLANSPYAGTPSLDGGLHLLYELVHQQAQMLSYLDALKLFAILFMALCPLLLLMKKGRIAVHAMPPSEH